MLRTVHFHGPLRAISATPITINADTVKEVIESLSRQLTGFRPNVATGRRRIKVVGYETLESLVDDLGDVSDLHIVPQVNGGKDSGGWTQILIGAALVGASFIPGLGAFAPILMKVGAMAILGGLAQLLSPTPSSEDEKDRNRYLGVPKNTTALGTRIPILCGRRRVFGHVLAFNTNAIEFRGTAESSAGGK